MPVIEDIQAYEVLDSRANPTVKVQIKLSDGSMGEAIVPSGASTGSKEALELRDGDERFDGKGVLKAVNHVNESIANVILGMDAFRQSQVDNVLRELDGTKNYARLGANATLGVSMALARAGANALKIPLYRYLGGVNANVLPVPMCNIINGGAHADNGIDFQEFMIMPFGFTRFKEALRCVCEIYAILKKELQVLGYSTALGDEGGFAPHLADNTEPIELLMSCIKKAGYENRVKIALDVASSEFFKEGKYHLEGKTFSTQDLIKRYEELCAKYPICSIEDGLAEDDLEGWVKLTEALGDKIQLVGDDLFVTNEDILREGIIKKMANAVLIKPNQIGTVTQTMRTVRLAQRNHYKCIMSHRSGESEDSFISDFAVALNTGQIKTGALARGERTAKYNRLLEIERENDEFLGERF
ncbi:phosphopyruvate hydratase [Campylobacter sp. VicNov18]|uniref:phosphopyruvate hydratase n=1 Tax=Campylobacter bilis TaxID=2691918 RepID=UPI00130EED54|nr:phosphopyruvate hydratase [Campylobacter bilis]MPV63732.1 phosphopyruvate hydratase [Campylobacter hepaticus]MBM0637233.1 phosphopyruvate hydratase [Campylobacter bilis]MCC8277952.1 phosphopyruvate hydratase [Campylobacter bilis]MCC8299456.1 phosphopyruvate hydratase [Campylobacter bilis]MCC8300861.1 phosphopyruvate hydratase [Campylobacter bilis]